MADPARTERSGANAPPHDRPPLAQIILDLRELTAAMLAAAGRADWTAIEPMERRRRRLLGSLDGATDGRDPARASLVRDDCTTATAQLLTLDAELMRRVVESRDTTARQLAGLRGRGRARRAYGAAADVGSGRA